MLPNDNPTLIFMKDVILKNCTYIKEISNKIFKKALINFAVKVAPYKEVLEVIKLSGIGVEVYNQIELNLVKELNFENIIVDGTFKSDSFILDSILSKVKLINVDSIDELERINLLCEKHNIIQDVGIRINYSENSKMGISINELKKYKNTIKSLKYININAVHIHPGSNIKEFSDCQDKYIKMLESLEYISDNFSEVDYIDLGGGFQILSNNENQVNSYLNKIKNIFNNKNKTFILEPGRLITGDSGLLFAKISTIKEYSKFIILNIAIAPYIFCTGESFKYIFPDNINNKKRFDYSIGGIWPADNDSIASINLTEGIPYDINIGQDICILNAGAYVIDRLNEYSFEKVNIIMI